MKTIHLTPVGTVLEVATGTRLLEGLLAQRFSIETACGGKGLCATCHVHVRRGQDELSPRTAREERTLGRIDGSDADSRLACQSHVLGEGVILEVPEGMYVHSLEQIIGKVGQKAEQHYLHPINGKVLIPRNKIITRTMMQLFVTLSEELKKLSE